jgi:hypothetical protein
MRCAPRQVPERAGRGYQRRRKRRPALSTAEGSPVLPTPSQPLWMGPGTGTVQRPARCAWWVRTSAAVTAASATTAARAAAGSVFAAVPFAAR